MLEFESVAALKEPAADGFVISGDGLNCRCCEGNELGSVAALEAATDGIVIGGVGFNCRCCEGNEFWSVAALKEPTGDWFNSRCCTAACLFDISNTLEVKLKPRPKM